MARPTVRVLALLEILQTGGGFTVAELAAGVSDVDESTLALLDSRAVAQPWATAIAPVHLTGAWETLPRLGILSSFTIEQTRGMAAAQPLCRHMVGDRWRYEELPTWHWPMLSRPDELSQILHRTRPA